MTRIGWGPGPKSGLPFHLGVLVRDEGEFAQIDRLLGGRRWDTVLAEIGRQQEEFQTHPGRSPKLQVACAVAQRGGVTTLNISTPMFHEADSPKTKGPGRWAEAARGDDDPTWRHGLKNLAGFVSGHGITRVVPRPAWEAQHEAFGHTTCGCESAAEIQSWKDAFARWVDLAREAFQGKGVECWIALSHIKDAKTALNNIEMAPPADSWDVWDLDYYGNWPPQPDQSKFDEIGDTEYKGGPRGIRTHVKAAREMGKPFGVSEWGVTHKPGHRSDGGDNAFFVQVMHDLFVANADLMAYAVYYNTLGHRLGGGNAPRASGAFERLYKL